MLIKENNIKVHQSKFLRHQKELLFHNLISNKIAETSFSNSTISISEKEPRKTLDPNFLSPESEESKNVISEKNQEISTFFKSFENPNPISDNPFLKKKEEKNNNNKNIEIVQNDLLTKEGFTQYPLENFESEKKNIDNELFYFVPLDNLKISEIKIIDEKNEKNIDFTENNVNSLENLINSQKKRLAHSNSLFLHKKIIESDAKNIVSCKNIEDKKSILLKEKFLKLKKELAIFSNKTKEMSKDLEISDDLKENSHIHSNKSFPELEKENLIEKNSEKSIKKNSSKQISDENIVVNQNIYKEKISNSHNNFLSKDYKENSPQGFYSQINLNDSHNKNNKKFKTENSEENDSKIIHPQENIVNTENSIFIQDNETKSILKDKFNKKTMAFSHNLIDNNNNISNNNDNNFYSQINIKNPITIIPNKNLEKSQNLLDNEIKSNENINNIKRKDFNEKKISLSQNVISNENNNIFYSQINLKNPINIQEKPINSKKPDEKNENFITKKTYNEIISNSQNNLNQITEKKANFFYSQNNIKNSINSNNINLQQLKIEHLGPEVNSVGIKSADIEQIERKTDSISEKSLNLSEYNEEKQEIDINTNNFTFENKEKSKQTNQITEITIEKNENIEKNTENNLNTFDKIKESMNRISNCKKPSNFLINSIREFHKPQESIILDKKPISLAIISQQDDININELKNKWSKMADNILKIPSFEYKSKKKDNSNEKSMNFSNEKSKNSFNEKSNNFSNDKNLTESNIYKNSEILKNVKDFQKINLEIKSLISIDKESIDFERNAKSENYRNSPLNSELKIDESLKLQIDNKKLKNDNFIKNSKENNLENSKKNIIEHNFTSLNNFDKNKNNEIIASIQRLSPSQIKTPEILKKLKITAISLKNKNLYSGLKNFQKNYLNYQEFITKRQTIIKKKYFDLLKQIFNDLKIQKNIFEEFINQKKFIRKANIFKSLQKVCKAHKKWIKTVAKEISSIKLTKIFSVLKYNTYLQKIEKTANLHYKKNIFLYWKTYVVNKIKILKSKATNLYKKQLIIKAFITLKKNQQRKKRKNFVVNDITKLIQLKFLKNAFRSLNLNRKNKNKINFDDFGDFVPINICFTSSLTTSTSKNQNISSIEKINIGIVIPKKKKN